MNKSKFLDLSFSLDRFLNVNEKKIEQLIDSYIILFEKDYSAVRALHDFYMQEVIINSNCLPKYKTNFKKKINKYIFQFYSQNDIKKEDIEIVLFYFKSFTEIQQNKIVEKFKRNDILKPYVDNLVQNQKKIDDYAIALRALKKGDSELISKYLDQQSSLSYKIAQEVLDVCQYNGIKNVNILDLINKTYEKYSQNPKKSMLNFRPHVFLNTLNYDNENFKNNFNAIFKWHIQVNEIKEDVETTISNMIYFLRLERIADTIDEMFDLVDRISGIEKNEKDIINYCLNTNFLLAQSKNSKSLPFFGIDIRSKTAFTDFITTIPKIVDMLKNNSYKGSVIDCAKQYSETLEKIKKVWHMHQLETILPKIHEEKNQKLNKI